MEYKSTERELRMKQSLFNTKELAPMCEYCAVGITSPDESCVLCVRRGVMRPSSNCRYFAYDALKRRPRPKAQLVSFTPEEFSFNFSDSSPAETP